MPVPRELTKDHLVLLYVYFRMLFLHACYVVNSLILTAGCRAPVMVALALIELGLQYEDAVDMIRQ